MWMGESDAGTACRVRRLGGVWREIRRGNADVEAFSFPSFYVGCRRRFASMGPDEIARYQARKARNVVRYAVQHSPFFASLYRGYDLDDVWSLPVASKQAMMENLTAYNTAGLTRDEVLDFCMRVEQTRDFGLRLKGLNVGMSSGTSGNKSVEITSRREESTMRAAFFARFPFPRSKINMAFILRVSSPAFQLGVFGHRLTYISQLGTMESICGQVQRLEPNVLAAPPSMLRILARQVEMGGLSIAPEQLVSYAEVLDPEVKTYLGQVFGCPVYEIYKATEGAIAISCRQGSLHINEDLVAVELLNHEGMAVLPGTPSRRMLVTDLHKTVLPVVRYTLHDIVTVSPDPCPCGSAFRVIERIQGRADDVFWGVRTDSRALQFVFPDYIRRAVIVASDQIIEYEVVQTSPDSVVARIQGCDQEQQERIAKVVEDGIQQVFDQYGCQLPRVDVAFGALAPSRDAAKRIRIRRSFPVDV